MPEDQIKGLSEKELAEEFTRILRSEDPNAPENIAQFSFTELTYKHMPTISQMAVHLDRSVGCVRISSGYHSPAFAVRDASARNVLSRSRRPFLTKMQLLPGTSISMHVESADAKAQLATEQLIAENEKRVMAELAATAAEQGLEEGDEVEDAAALRNQFNFSERAMQVTLAATSFKVGSHEQYSLLRAGYMSTRPLVATPRCEGVRFQCHMAV